MIYAWVFLVVALAGAINAARGGRFEFVNNLPGHTRLWASLAFTVLALAYTLAPLNALAWGACYLIWSIPPWGHWFDLGNAPDLEREMSPFEKIIDRAAFGNDNIAFFLRNLLALMPAVILVHPLAILLAPAQSLSYAIGWKWFRTPITYAEIYMGLCWGVALVALGG